MMKKLWSAVLVLCMILAVMTVSAFAADVPVRASGSGVTFTVKADKTEVRPGDTITFSVYISEVENLAGALFTLSIPEGLTFVKGSSSVPAYLKDEYDFGEASFAEKTMAFLVSHSTSFSSMTETKLLSFQCTVNENAPETMTMDLDVDADDVFDGDYNNLPFTIIGATVVNYHEYVYGFCVDCGGYEPAVLNGDVYEISNAGQLYWFAEQVNSGNTSINGKLMTDIVVNENVLKEDGTLNGDGSNFRVWTPIGNDTNRYAGTFDGNGKTVSGLYFKDAEKIYVGLFGYVHSGCVQNVGVEDSYLSGGGCVGGVVGLNYGTVSDCYNTGSVSGNEAVGGVVGLNYGTVSDCYNTGSVSGTYYVGGVVGENTGTVSDCYNTSTVSVDDFYVGGVVGYNYSTGTVSNCYFLFGCVAGDNSYGTAMTAQQFASGEVAYLLGQDFGQAIGTDTAPILNGKMVYQNQIGGCCADSFVYDYSNTQADAVTTHSWVEATCTAPKTCSSCGETIGEALDHSWVDATCDTVKTCSVCGTTEGSALGHSYGNGFCVRCGVYESAVLNGDVYEISNAGQLYWFAAQVNSGNTGINGKLMADIVVNENVLNADGTLNGDGSNFRVWTPIGNYDYQYIGTFDGNGKTVSGLYFNDAEKDYVGLFGYVDNGCVKNVGVVDSYLSGNYYVGGVVGVNSCTVRNCYNTGSVSGNKCVGGLVGYNTDTVSDCYNTGSVSGSGDVGGVVGDNFYGDVTNCYNTGGITGNDHAGGVVGINYSGTVTNCSNNGSICGSDASGGVVGGNNSGTVKDCNNVGSVSGSSCVGGVDGYNEGSVTNCYYLSGCVSNGNSDGTAMTAQQFASGEVAYLLQGDQTEQVWGQLIGAEPYPVLSKDKVYGGNGHYYNDCDHYWDGGSCTEGVNCFICGAVSSYFPGHQWQDATCDQPKTCSVCGTTEGKAQGHSYEGVVTEPDCTHAGFTTYTCTGCGDSYYEDFVAPLGHETYAYSFVNGVHSLTCSLCGVTENMTSTDGKQFKFNTASPALAVDIVMNIAVTLPAGFTNPYMVVEFNGTTTTLNDYTIDQSNGRCVFAFPGINPQVMGDTFVATLYADVDGVQVTVELEYSMLKYINSQLKKSTISDALRTALSDLVMYGEANQVYEGYKTDALLSSLLEDAAKENLTPSTFVNLDAGYNQMAITGTAHSSIDLKGVTMALGSKVIVRMTVYCADPSAYTVKVTINGEDHLYPVSQLPLAAGYTDRYVLEFDQIRATQFGEVITFSFLDADGNQLGRTLTYSVYTYVQKNQGSANANLANLLKAIYNYGESVKNI